MRQADEPGKPCEADGDHSPTGSSGGACCVWVYATGMSSAEETRLMEVLVTHNEPVSCVDLACVMRMTPAGVQALAIRLQARGYVLVDDDNETVAATPAADAALRGGVG